MPVSSLFINCQLATLLIERRADGLLSAGTRGQLWAHLRLCRNCRRYEFQSGLIARQARALAAAQPLRLVLPAAARVRLQHLLAAAYPADPGTRHGLSGQTGK